MPYKKLWLGFLLVLIVLGIAAVFVQPRGLLLMRINLAKGQWQSQPVANYRMSIRSASAWSRINIELEVREGQVVNSSCTSDWHQHDCNIEYQQFLIPELFNTADTIVSSFSEHNRYGSDYPCFNVDFDATYHYPATMEFDCSNVFDEEWLLQVLSFEPLP